MFGHDNVTARAEQISLRLDEKSALINTNTKVSKTECILTIIRPLKAT